MEKIAFRMTLRAGCVEEYRRRHNALWPELEVLLREAGITDYSIYHDPDTNALFATLWRTVPHGMDALPAHPVMRRWWDHMADLMETEADHSPRIGPLDCLFHLI